MRAFVTGGHGFVGQWLVAHLVESGDRVVAPSAAELDVTDAPAVQAAIAEAAPEAVYHLAGLAHVGSSWRDPVAYMTVNAMGTMYVLEAARHLPAPPRVLVVSSAEVYGAVPARDVPLTESAPVRPVSPYAVSKAAAELLAVQAHLGYGVPAIVARPFNHIGPGQSPAFVVPALARRIAAAVREGAGELAVGNLQPRRDLADVRDVVRAYRALVSDGVPGDAYNVCAGVTVTIGELVDRMLAIAGADLRVRVDESLVRPVDVPVLAGDPSKIRAATGWRPAMTLDDTLREVLAEAGAAC